MSFGIVTSMKFRTIPAPSENVLFYYPYMWNSSQAKDGWDAWQEYCAGETVPIIPAEMNVRWLVVNNGGAEETNSSLLFMLEGAYHGSEEDFKAGIKPLLDRFAEIGGLQADVRGVGTHTCKWFELFRIVEVKTLTFSSGVVGCSAVCE